MKASLENRIDLWLDDRREASAGGGWAHLTDEDVWELTRIVHDLVKAKCAPDADGDRPVQVILINRRKHRPLHHAHVAYEGAYGDVVEPLLDNVRWACDALNTEMECRAREGIRAGTKIRVKALPDRLKQTLLRHDDPELQEGRTGTVVGPAVQVKDESGSIAYWMPILWDDKEAPRLHDFEFLQHYAEEVKDE